MSEQTKIQWCDHTASPWHGCTKVAAGCENCYAEALSKRNPGTLGIWGDDGVRVKSKSFIANLRKWNKSAAERGVIESVFPSLCDPLLAKIDLTDIPHAGCGSFDALDGRSWDESESDGKSCSTNGGLDWVIVGGESGHNARPCDIAWIGTYIPDSSKENCELIAVRQLGL